DRSKELDAVDQTWTRTAEVRDAIDANDPRGADRSEGRGLARGTRRVPAARHRDHDLRTRRDHIVPADLARARAGRSEHVLATGDPHLLGHPVTAIEQRVEPL